MIPLKRQINPPSERTFFSLLLPTEIFGERNHMENAHAKKMVAKACWWVRKNPDKWSNLRQFCWYLKEQGEPIQRGNIYELARRYGMDISLASNFRRDHNLWSVLARYLVMESPSLLKVICFRTTPIDEIDLPQYWIDIVGRYTFQAKSLDEARKIYEANL